MRNDAGGDAMNDCRETRALAIDYAAGRLDRDTRARLEAHLEGCASCRDNVAVETALEDALDRRLPRYQAPAALKQALEARFLAAPAADDAPPALAKLVALAPPPPVVPRAPRARRWIAPVLSAGAAAALTVVLMVAFGPRPPRPDGGALVAEALSDHMRVVASTHPLDVESGGIHQVKPWFTGRIDFAPRVAFSGDGDFPLMGGSLGYVFDRKAAVLVFKRRLHTITLLVFPPDGLAWPAQAPVTVGRLSVVAQSRHGFSVLLWRDGDLGYALVSDVARADLETLATKIAGPEG
jgi:anti-sigma factor RsiW